MAQKSSKQLAKNLEKNLKKIIEKVTRDYIDRRHQAIYLPDDLFVHVFKELEDKLNNAIEHLLKANKDTAQLYIEARSKIIEDKEGYSKELVTEFVKRFKDKVKSSRAYELDTERVYNNATVLYIHNKKFKKNRAGSGGPAFKWVGDKVTEIRKDLFKTTSVNGRILGYILNGVDRSFKGTRGKTKSAGLVGKREKAELTDSENKVHKGMHLGHIFGTQATRLERMREAILEYSNKYLLPKNHKLTSKFVHTTNTEIDGKIKIDANLEMNSVAFPAIEEVFGTGKFTSIFTLEIGPDNTSTGGQVNNAHKVILDLVLKELEQNFLNYKFSPSITEKIDQNITDAFYDKKSKTKATKKTKRFKIKKDIRVQNIKIKSSKPKISKEVPSGIRSISKFDQSEGTLSQLEILKVVNNRLHDQIQKNMGKGAAKELLNYRTGRFARSVELETLIPSKTGKTAEARVKYMQYPYGVFEPGGRLYKPGRDPHGIIGKSIRQILQEQQIANLARVGVQLHG